MHIGQIGISEFICVPCPVTRLIVWVHFGYNWDTFAHRMDRHSSSFVFPIPWHSANSLGDSDFDFDFDTLTLCPCPNSLGDTLSPRSDGAWPD